MMEKEQQIWFRHKGNQIVGHRQDWQKEMLMGTSKQTPYFSLPQIKFAHFFPEAFSFPLCCPLCQDILKVIFGSLTLLKGLQPPWRWQGSAEGGIAVGCVVTIGQQQGTRELQYMDLRCWVFGTTLKLLPPAERAGSAESRFIPPWADGQKGSRSRDKTGDENGWKKEDDDSGKGCESVR